METITYVTTTTITVAAASSCGELGIVITGTAVALNVIARHHGWSGCLGWQLTLNDLGVSLS